MREALVARIHAVEEAYEFMLAYAAQGLAREDAALAGGQLRTLMTRAVDALDGLGPAIDATCAGDAALVAFRDLVAADAGRALVVLRLALAQPSISSALVDNLNASLHLRTLLTDLFLLDEALKAG